MVEVFGSPWCNIDDVCGGPWCSKELELDPASDELNITSRFEVRAPVISCYYYL